jgi:hypothetical protein
MRSKALSGLFQEIGALGGAEGIRFRFFLGGNKYSRRVFAVPRRLIVLLFACPNEIIPPVLLPALFAVFCTARFFLAIA